MKKISLIIPTLNNSNNIECFLNSINNKQICNLEIIIIDQTKSKHIQDICKQFNNNYNKIIYIKSNLIGLSINRNIGLQKATGEIVAFPDDDCMYYSDTLERVIYFFTNNNYKKYDAVIGQIYDKNYNKTLIKNWPRNKKRISKINFYSMCSSITIFVKRNKFMFNENLGSGSKYGSCEDVDYIYNLLLSGKRIFYNPEIKVWHPEINNKNISLIRVESYAAGLGYFISYKKSLIKFGLLLGCVFIKLFQFIFKNNDYNKRYFYNYFTGFIRGLMGR